MKLLLGTVLIVAAFGANATLYDQNGGVSASAMNNSGDDDVRVDVSYVSRGKDWGNVQFDILADANADIPGGHLKTYAGVENVTSTIDPDTQQVSGTAYSYSYAAMKTIINLTDDPSSTEQGFLDVSTHVDGYISNSQWKGSQDSTAASAGYSQVTFESKLQLYDNSGNSIYSNQGVWRYYFSSDSRDWQWYQVNGFTSYDSDGVWRDTSITGVNTTDYGDYFYLELDLNNFVRESPFINFQDVAYAAFTLSLNTVIYSYDNAYLDFSHSAIVTAESGGGTDIAGGGAAGILVGAERAAAPAPATAALLGLGLAGISFQRRRNAV